MLLLALTIPPAAAQDSGLPRQGPRNPGTSASRVPAALRGVGIDQRLNQQLPLDLSFRDEGGQLVELRRYFGHKPVVLLLMYFDCPMLCSQALGGLTTALSVVTLAPGRDFQVVVVSFDPSDTPEAARARKQAALHRYRATDTIRLPPPPRLRRSGSGSRTPEASREGGNPDSPRTAADGWHFLTGDPEPIRRLTEAVGFHYLYDRAIDQFAHATAVMVLTPEGRLSRYLYGIEYPARDLRLALVEASRHQIGNRVDQLLLYCFHYDPATGRYSIAILNIVRLGGIITLVVLGGFVVVMLIREKPRSPESSQSTQRTL